MKVRESGMPDEGYWEGFFDVDEILKTLQLTANTGDVVDFGCGYGTFTIPAARIVSGIVHAIDIEEEMVERTVQRAGKEGLFNLKAVVRDFVAEGTGLPEKSADYVMLFNILHAELPEVMLADSYRILVKGGKLTVIHWNYDPDTPRGPPMEIRPRPEQIIAWTESAGFELLPPGIINLPPYHYGLIFTRP